MSQKSIHYKNIENIDIFKFNLMISIQCYDFYFKFPTVYLSMFNTYNILKLKQVAIQNEIKLQQI